MPKMWVAETFSSQYARYLVEEGFLNCLLHVGGRRSRTKEQRNYGEVITKKLTSISAPLSGRLGCLRMNGMKLDIHHRVGLGTVSGDRKMRSPFWVRNLHFRTAMYKRYINSIIIIIIILLVIQEYISFISNNCIRSITLRLLEPGHLQFFFFAAEQ